MFLSNKTPQATRIVALFLLIIPFLPLELFFGKLKGADGSLSSFEWFLITMITMSLCTLASLYAPNKIKKTVLGLLRLTSASQNGILIASLVCLISAELVLTGYFAFWNRPHLVDEIVQAFQGKIFAAGKLTAPKPVYESFFISLHMLMDENGWYSQYPPGHSALLGIGELFAAPWLIPRLLSIASAVLIYLSCKELYGKKTGFLSLLLIAFCPFFIFMGASEMNHISTLFFISLFFYSYLRWERSASAFFLTLAGFAMGGAALIRPLTAIAIAIPFTYFALIHVKKDKAYFKLIPGIISACLVSSLFLIYNKLTSGDALIPGYIKLWGKSHGLGFQESPWGEMHTPLTGLRNELIDLRLINEYLFEWPIPSLLPICLFLIFSKKISSWDKRLFYSFLCIPATYFFYWHRDAFLGPRFLYEGLIFLIPLSARSIIIGLEELKQKIVWKINVLELAKMILLFSVLYACLVAIPQRFLIYASSFKSEKIDLLKEAKKEGIDKGLIFISVSWGNRTLAKIKARGISASLAQKGYSFSDSCLFYLLGEKAERENWNKEILAKEIQLLIDKKDSIQKFNKLNQDPTLKLRPDVRLDPRCAEEIRYDQEGYTLFEPSLTANNIDLSGPLVFARDLRGENKKLLELYPDLPVYVYRGERFVRIK